MINDQGLGQFYELKQGLATVPVKSRPFEEHDFSWLPALIEKAEQSQSGEASLDLALDGISCVGCVWLIETIFARYPGSIRAAAHPAQGMLHVEWMAGACDLAGFFKEITQFGYMVAPSDSNSVRGEMQKLQARMGLCGAFALNAMAFSLPTYLGMPRDFMFADLFRLIAFLSATFAMLIGGGWFIQRAWRALRIGNVHMDLPIALGLVAAYAGSIIGWIVESEKLVYFDFVAMFVFLMLVGRTLQTSAVDRNRKRLIRQQPVPRSFASADANDADILLEKIDTDMCYLLRPGQANPVAAVVQDQHASFSLEWINGEAESVNFAPGSRLPAGAILLSRMTIALKASEAWEDSLLARLTAPNHGERSHAFLDRLLRYWIAVILLIGLLGFLWHTLHHQWITGLQVMISVFVVSCPCALGVAIPLADDLAATKLQHLGVFLRSTTFWSRIRKVQHIIFDKTGTLTLERPLLIDEASISLLDDTAALALARLTSKSLHPISRSLLEHLGARGQQLLMQSDKGEIIEHPGMGVEWIDDQTHWTLGRSEWKSAESATSAATVLRCNGRSIAEFSFKDSLRPSAISALDALHRLHITLHILSGDHPHKVQEIARLLQIPPENAKGSLLPDEKAAIVQKIDQQNTLFIGDGANDSLAFDAAYVTGTPVTDRSLLESKADFYTLGAGLSFLPQLFAIAAERARGVSYAFVFAFSYNVSVVTLALLGRMNPLLAAIVMPLSSLVSLTLIAFSLQKRTSLVDQSQDISYTPADAEPGNYQIARNSP
jgi:P-type Cu2+ transporter